MGQVDEIQMPTERTDEMVAYDKHWQRPAATEEAAFRSLQSLREPLGFIYYGVAWATLMDGLKARNSKAVLVAPSASKSPQLADP